MAGDDAEDMLIAALWDRRLPYPGADEYHRRYVQRYGTVPDYHGAEAYAAVLVAADALRRAQNLDADRIREALDETDMVGPFGPVRFQSYERFERQNRVQTIVLKLAERELSVVWPRSSGTLESTP
jgi:branched-chain amino acid transport system substrate-binding protein